MPLHSDILDLMRARDIAATRSMRRALDEFVELIAAENPDVDMSADDDGDDDDDDDDGDDDAGLAVRTIDCPHCGEPVVVELELDGGDQEAIHDCSVCCRPIRLVWSVRDGRLDGFTSTPG